MRCLPAVARDLGLPQPDIVVSELLGSFGDNELSPECLDGVTSFLKPTTINIPQSYTSYAVPIMSLIMHQSIRATGASYYTRGIPGHGRQGPVQLEDGTYDQMYPQGKHAANMDQVYVVFLKQHCRLNDPQLVFQFDHPNFEEKSNERNIELKFPIDRPADVMGFAGYFSMVLYKDVILSTVPATHSKDMISWFPALLPLREFLRVQEGDELTFHIDRKVDDTGVWYEWFASLKVMLSSLVSGSSPATTGVLASSRKGTALLTAVRCHGRRMPRQGKPPILPPAKKVLYHVVHVPWQKPEYVKEMLWRRHVYLNAITSMKQIFEGELKAKEGDRQGVDAMKVEEQDEFEQLLQKNEQRNKKLAQTRAIRDKEEWTELKKEILEEIDSHLTKERQLAEKATEEVRQAIERSASFVDKSNLEARIKEALEKPIVYDFAIDKIGRKISNPAPVKYNEGTPTRQKGRLYDSTLGAGMQTDVDAVRQLSQQMVGVQGEKEEEIHEESKGQ
ncbi:hypothetical protein WR25_02284 [Diploscapter pachys]|uniref:Uncharacterized protein n=1 Tax=Diploscapter pachys TaxID=2018661 RepID=A0A2A2JGM0_9BILA|nr:hypothetical protein WR25_02284 [Diploscapter pachys]